MTEFEEDLQIMGVSDLHTVVRHRKEWRHCFGEQGSQQTVLSEKKRKKTKS
jgi:hypothetical protein